MLLSVASLIGLILWDMDNHLRLTLKQLITAYPQVDIVAMGFPKDWLQQALWV